MTSEKTPVLFDWRSRTTLSQPEVAEVLGKDPDIVRAAVKAGQIPSIQIGKRRVVPVRALERLLLEGSPTE